MTISLSSEKKISRSIGNSKCVRDETTRPAQYYLEELFLRQFLFINRNDLSPSADTVGAVFRSSWNCTSRTRQSFRVDPKPDVRRICVNPTRKKMRRTTLRSFRIVEVKGFQGTPGDLSV